MAVHIERLVDVVGMLEFEGVGTLEPGVRRRELVGGEQFELVVRS